MRWICEREFPALLDRLRRLGATTNRLGLEVAEVTTKDLIVIIVLELGLVEMQLELRDVNHEVSV